MDPSPTGSPTSFKQAENLQDPPAASIVDPQQETTKKTHDYSKYIFCAICTASAYVAFAAAGKIALAAVVVSAGASLFYAGSTPRKECTLENTAKGAGSGAAVTMLANYFGLTWIPGIGSAFTLSLITHTLTAKVHQWATAKA